MLFALRFGLVTFRMVRRDGAELKLCVVAEQSGQVGSPVLGGRLIVCESTCLAHVVWVVGCHGEHSRVTDEPKMARGDENLDSLEQIAVLHVAKAAIAICPGQTRGRGSPKMKRPRGCAVVSASWRSG
jgi:hypothetical protein